MVSILCLLCNSLRKRLHPFYVYLMQCSYNTGCLSQLHQDFVKNRPTTGLFIGVYGMEYKQLNVFYYTTNKPLVLFLLLHYTQFTEFQKWIAVSKAILKSLLHSRSLYNIYTFFFLFKEIDRPLCNVLYLLVFPRKSLTKYKLR